MIIDWGAGIIRCKVAQIHTEFGEVQLGWSCSTAEDAGREEVELQERWAA